MISLVSFLFSNESALGYDGGKKVKGRKRHLLVDSQGLLLKVKVLAANKADQEGAKQLLQGIPVQFPCLHL